MEFVNTDKAPAPAGHYSQAVKQGGFVFVSGQLPIDPLDPEKKEGTIEEQTRQALLNMSAILEASGSSISNVVKTTVYISDICHWSRVNTVYSDFFGNHRPARAVVPTRELHYRYMIEIEAIASL